MSSTKAPNLTKRSIGAKLTAAGHEASKRMTSTVRGWHNYSQGFVVNESGPNESGPVFVVEHRTFSFRAGESERSGVLASLGLYAETLRSAGYEVEEHPDQMELVVTLRKLDG